MKNIGIIGAGASGLYAAINVKSKENSVTILEKNASPGQKILMTGNGRCNITSTKYFDEFLENIATNKKFIYSSFNQHDNYATMSFFEENGLELIREDDDRVFPKSQKANDVVKFFEDELIDKNIKLVTDAEVLAIAKSDKGFRVSTSGKDYDFDRLIIATGGLSYPNTGSTGDGYSFAKNFGHRVTKTYPSLVPIYFKDTDLGDIKALNLDASIHIKLGGKSFDEFGSFLLSKNFITGPAVLRLSSYAVGEKVEDLYLDLVVESREDMDDILLEIFVKNSNKDISNVLKEIIPQALIPVILKRAGVNPDKKANQVSREERISLISKIRHFDLAFDRLGGYNTAIITRGGVDVDEINPKTMESKLVDGLYFVGEVLDIDALTGGFNLQLAFTTAFAAATAIKEEI